MTTDSVTTTVVMTTAAVCQRKLEEEIERKRRHLREQAAIIKDKANDINKANEIISKLQNDNIAFHSEVELLTRFLVIIIIVIIIIIITLCRLVNSRCEIDLLVCTAVQVLLLTVLLCDDCLSSHSWIIDGRCCV